MESDCVFKHGVIFFTKTFYISDSALFRCTSLKGKVFVKVADCFRTVIVHVCRLLNTGAHQYASVNVGCGVNCTTVEHLVTTTSHKKPWVVSDLFSDIPEVSRSNHYVYNLL